MPDYRPSGSWFDAGTKAFLIASMAAAIAVGAVFGARGWPDFPVTCVVLFLLAWSLGRWAPSAAWILTLGVTFAVPVVISVVHGDYYWNFNPVWYAWTLGFLVARTRLTRWSFPEHWRVPLVFWALIIAASWPVIVAREADFTWKLLSSDLPPNSGVGGAPWFVSGWITSTACIYGIGLLWLDALLAEFSDDPVAFRRLVLWPLGVGATLACLVAIYQGLIDITWWSGGQWPTIGRAPGTFLDADAFGAFAGWWTIIFAAFAAAPAPRAFRIFGAGGFLVAWGGLWASGSRMALLGGLIGLVVASWEGGRYMLRQGSSRAIKIAVAVILVAAVGLAVAAPRVHWTTASPLARALTSFRNVPMDSIGQFARDTLWNRGAPYGTVSMQMVRESPIAGVGIGMFHTMFPDYAYVLLWRSTPDNAQSWYRHQLAELGIVGSLGWIVWLCSFVVLMVRGRVRPGCEAEARIARAALLAVGVISAISMPTQHFANAFVVIVLVAWYSLLVDLSPLEAPSSGRLGRLLKPLAIAVVVLYVTDAGYVGWTKYRPAFRALMADWGYAYGLYDPEVIDGVKAQWTEKHAVDVIAAPTRWMQLTYWVNFGDVAANPVDVKIWRDRQLIARTRLRSVTPVVAYVRVPDDDRRVMLETESSRVVKPSDFGAADDRELGLAVSWTFVSGPPGGATVVN
ncbi:MAG TPA: hypothetical protein VHZ73_05780 [Vicinamibacterales bacterium]|nr:hypothetical protein [Vicinamibacterales bacterium]